MIELVPLKLFSQRLSEGWMMVPGYPLEPGDWAVTMASPDWLADDYPNNKSRGSASAQATKRNRKVLEAA